RPWHPGPLGPVGRARAGVACGAGAAVDPTRDHRGLLGGAGRPGHPDGPPGGAIAALAKPDPGVQALMALPGVGKLTAMTLLAEIGDIGRFPSARKLCAWAGLTPQVRNSDRTLRHGHLTKQ